MADEMETLGLDASQYLDTIGKIQKLLSGLNSEYKSVNFQLGHMDVAIQNQTVNIKKWVDASTQVNTTLKMVDGNLKVVGSSINVATGGVDKQTYALRELERAMNAVASVKAYNKSYGVTGREGQLDLQIAMDREEKFVQLQRDSKQKQLTIQDDYIQSVLDKQRALYNQLESEYLANQGRAAYNRSAPGIVTGGGTPNNSANAIPFNSAENVSMQKGLANAYANSARYANEYEAALKKTTETQNNYRRSVFLTLEQMGRLFVILTLRDAFYNFAGALRASITNTKEFEIQIGEIQTIAQRSSETFNQWAANITKLSDISGRDLKDVGEGVYQTLSNQVATGAEAVMFLSKALDFSRVSVASTADSVNLLSGVINSFGMNVYDTDKIASSLFKTIELGRVRASEMADTFGRIGVLANRLGITLYETEAAVTTLTIQGVKFSDASTQIINIMSKLIRPSKDLEAVFKSWGVNSGEAAIATFGFAGVLQKLEQQSHGSSEELATLFRDIRGTRGILGLTGGAFDKFTESLKQVANQSDYVAAKQLAAANAGRDWEVQLNALKNYFTTDFGRPFLETTAATLKNLGGLVPVVKETVVVIKTLGETYIAYRAIKLLVNITEATNLEITRQMAVNHLPRLQASLRAAQISWFNLRAAVVGMITPMNVAVAAITLAAYAWNKYQQDLEELARFHDDAETRITAAVQKTTDIIIKENQKQLEAITAGVDKRYKANYEFFNNVNLLETKASDKIKELVDTTNEHIKESFQNSFKDLELSISKINRLAEEAKSNAIRARELATSITEQTNTKVFEAGLSRLPPDQQLAAIKQKITQTQTAIAKELKAPANNDPDAAKSNLRLAEKQIQEQDRLFADAERRRAIAVEKIKTLEQSILETREKQSSADTINEDRSNVTEAQRDLRSQRKSKHPIDRRNVDEAQDTLSNDRNAEANRLKEEHLAKLQQELTVQQSIVSASLTDSEAAKKKVEYAKQQVDLLQKYATLQEQVSKQQSEEADRLRHQLEASRILFEELGSKFKADKVQTPEQKTALLKRFDTQVQGGISSDAVDKGTLFELSKKREALEAEADDNIRKHTIESNRARATESERIIKTSLATASEQKTKISEKFNFDLQALKELEAEYARARGATLDTQKIRPVEKAIAAFGTEQSPAAAERARQQFFSQLGSLDFTRPEVIKPKTAYDPGRTTLDVIADFNKALQDAQTQISSQSNLAKAQAQAEANLKKVGIERQNIEKSASELLKDFGDQYINHIKAASQTIQDVTRDFKALEVELQTFLKKPVSYAPIEAPGTPVTGVASIGGGAASQIVIHYNSQGAGSAQDAVSLGRAIQAEQRRGTLS